MRHSSYRFIRDPSEEDYHPVRDMVEKPFFLQLEKILVSLVIYSTISFFSIAGMSVDLAWM